MSWKIRTPFQIALVGPSQCGKSQKLLSLLKHDLSVFTTALEKVIYAAPGLEQISEKDFGYLAELKKACAGKELSVISEIPSLPDLLQSVIPHKTVLILDDLLLFPNLDGLTSLSSLHAHHRGLSVIYMLQNPYQNTRKTDLVTVTRNLTGKFVFYATNDWRALYTLNTQHFPEKKKFLINCLLAAKEEGLNYVYINSQSHSELPRRFSVYTALTPDELGDSPLFFDLEA